MSTKVAQATLIDAAKELRFRWQRAASDWDDSASRRFEREVLGPIEPALVGAIKALEQVSEITARVRRECDDPGRS